MCVRKHGVRCPACPVLRAPQPTPSISQAQAYLGHSKTWRGRYLLFEGYADLLQGTTEFTAADLETLRRVTKDGSKTLIERVYAHSAHGRLRWTLGEGDEAARAYRKALELAASATLQHRSELVLSHHGRSNPTWVPARELFDFFMQQNKTSLATLIGVGPCGMMSLLKQGDRCYAWPTLGNSAEQATARQAAMSRATIIRSAICAQCGATDKKLFCCSKCKLAYYCSTACQRAGWKVHQPQCRAPGDFCAGDYVMLHGLYDTSGRRHGGNLSEREMNGYFFRVVERDAEEAGVWRVENRILVQRTVSVHVDNMRHVLTH